MSMPEAVQKVLSQIEARAREADAGDSYRGLVALAEMPTDALAEVGDLTRLDGDGALTSLLIENRTGQAQVELCPFGPLALVSSDGDMDTDAIAQALADAGITPLFPGDLDQAAPWHGTPLGRWLFPRRLADALALFDGLRG